MPLGFSIRREKAEPTCPKTEVYKKSLENQGIDFRNVRDSENVRKIENYIIEWFRCGGILSATGTF